MLNWGVAIDCVRAVDYHGNTELTTSYHVVVAENEVQANVAAEGLKDFMQAHEAGEFYVARVVRIDR